jgi:hypothetical protein
MPLLAVHGDFTSHAAGVHLKQKLEMSRTVAVGEIELVGYQITFDGDSTNVPDHIIVNFSPDWLAQQVIVAHPPAKNGSVYPSGAQGIPLPVEGTNTVKFGLSGLKMRIQSRLPMHFEIKIYHYDDQLPGIHNQPDNTDTIIPMTRPTPGQAKLNHVILFFKVE